MKEAHLHYLFESKKLGNRFITTDGKKIEVIDHGELNFNSGPDFKNAQLIVDGTTWSGHVEFHLKSSDWYRHRHQDDPAYNNVIAHFVYEHDMEVFSAGYSLPTVEIASLIPNADLQKINDFMNRKSKIICETYLSNLDKTVIAAQLNLALKQRLNRKKEEVLHLIDQHNGDQFKSLLILFAKAFGGKVNQFAFMKLIERIEMQQFFQLNLDQFKLSALLHGMSGLLASADMNEYTSALRVEFSYQQHLFGLGPMQSVEWNTATFRPVSFPSFRIEQFSALLVNLLKTGGIIKTNNYKDLFLIKTHSFWENHYNFSTDCKTRQTKFSKGFVEHLLINVVVPFNLAINRMDQNNELEKFMETLSAENNSVITEWKKAGLVARSAMESQALIEQKNEFCNRKKCLFCGIGKKLLTE